MSILVCYDGSASSRSAVAKVAAVASGQHVILLHVWSPPDRFLADSFGTSGAATPSYSDLEVRSRERAKEIAEQGRKLAEELGLDVEGRDMPSGSSIWRTILDVADGENATLIAVGTHGGTPVQPAPLGSVSNALAHHSNRAVLIVPHADPAS